MSISYDPISELFIKIINKEFGYKINYLLQSRSESEDNTYKNRIDKLIEKSSSNRYKIIASDNIYDFILNINSYTLEPFANPELIYSQEFTRLINQDNISLLISLLGYSEIFGVKISTLMQSKRTN